MANGIPRVFLLPAPRNLRWIDRALDRSAFHLSCRFVLIGAPIPLLPLKSSIIVAGRHVTLMRKRGNQRAIIVTSRLSRHLVALLTRHVLIGDDNVAPLAR